MPRNKTEFFSIFGQIEMVVAEAMIAEGTVTRIAGELIPETVAYDEEGNRAKFAIVIDSRNLRAFEDRVARLRA